jgi:hypothetical protein
MRGGCGIALAAAAVVSGGLGGMFDAGLQHRAIRYYTAPVTDPVYELNRRIQDGETRLEFSGKEGYLRGLLAALDIPVESQLAVFSKTSLLARLIDPAHPRTIFFNDSVAVTWIPGEPFVELAAEDPRQGIVFYALDNKPAEKPTIARHTGDCLNCHDTLASLGVPGMTVRSVLAGADGTPMSYLGNSFPDDRTAFSERWGGWYVTGKSLPPGHRGNARVTGEGGGRGSMVTAAANLESLRGAIDLSAYLTPYSDVVALMVFEHQMHMMNLMTRVGWDARVAGHEVPEETNELVDYLLFADEWPLAAPVKGNSGFEEKFSAEGPRDRKGRSLRQFDLRRRLMRYPCSYMIYSPAFDGLPPDERAAIYRRMWRILSGEERGGKYARLSPSDREAVVEILRETKPEVRDFFPAEEREMVK